MRKHRLLIAALPVLLLSATAPALEPPTFSNEVVRIPQTRCQLVRWIEADAPEGDSATLPSPLVFPEG